MRNATTSSDFQKRILRASHRRGGIYNRLISKSGAVVVTSFHFYGITWMLPVAIVEVCFRRSQPSFQYISSACLKKL